MKGVNDLFQLHITFRHVQALCDVRVRVFSPLLDSCAFSNVVRCLESVPMAMAVAVADQAVRQSEAIVDGQAITQKAPMYFQH